MAFRLVLIGMGMAGLAACSAAPPDAAVRDQPPAVRIAQVGAGQSATLIEAVGTVALQRETALAFTSAGRIAALRVTEGDSVRAGQRLAALDATTTAADLSAARAERDRAAADYRRSATLLAQGWVTRPRVEAAQAALMAAQARVRAAGFQTANAVITAPGPGVVLARLAEPGQVVAAGTPVLVFGDRGSGFVLRLPLSDRDAAQLRIGAPATVRIAAIDEQVTGSVREIAGRSDRATGSFAVEIALPDDPRLRSGQIGTATIIAAGAGQTVLRVPPPAIFAPRAGQAFVYIFDEATQRVKLRRIAIADVDDGSIRVTGGLRAGEWVAVSRVDRLTDNLGIVPLRAGR